MHCLFHLQRIVLEEVAIVATAIEIPVVLVAVQHEVIVVLVARFKNRYVTAHANVLLEALIRITAQVHQFCIQLHVGLQCTIKVLPVHKLYLLAGYGISIDQLQQRIRIDRLHHVQLTLHIAASVRGKTPFAKLRLRRLHIPEPGEQWID